MYKTQPKNPVDFLAKWLLNYAQVEKQAVSQGERKEFVKEMKDKHQYQQQVAEKERHTKLKEAQEAEKKVEDFYSKVNSSKDLTDQLQDLADFLKEQTQSTAVYIGKLVQPKKPIGPEDDERAHIDEDAKSMIQYLNATEGHDYMVGQTLKEEQGLTFDVFRADETNIDD